MNCSEFEDRFHQLVDDRMSIDHDQELQLHADSCVTCCERLVAWQKIESVFSVKESGTQETVSLDFAQEPSRLHRTVLWAMGVAAAIMLVMSLNTQGQPEKTTAELKLDAEEQLVQVDPAQWWQSMQSQDWVAQTMPAVMTVRDGVAPIGRSLRSAVVILTSSGDQA